ncbi:glycosyltransferase family 2 protein [Sulfurihydrogenibium azorense]|uniref:glycosyltransferase family 2 protein n=1 Tax=Sulfurihydrogenibium azorense TaxID=309806 RepID=UPI003919863F
MPQVSVIIPVYNGEKYIKESINSVLNQTFKDLEIVIVNDASTDNTEKVIFENFGEFINKDNIKYFKNKENKGRNISGNIGAEKASGKYLFFLDADDLWEKNHIETVLKEFIKDGSLDIVFAKPRTFIDESGKIKRISKSKIEKDLDKIIFSSKIGFPSATAFKKESFIGYNPEFKYREDIELFIRARLKGQHIKILDTDTVLIREHSSPTRMSKTNFFYQYTLILYQEYKDKIPKKYLPYFYFHISEIAFKFGDFKIAYKMLIEAIKQNPKVLLDKKNLLTFLKRAIRIDRMLTSNFTH